MIRETHRVPGFLYDTYEFLTHTELDNAGENGLVDPERFRQLASRPISERNLDVQAYDSLYQAAARGDPRAKYTLALFLGRFLGFDNSKKMLSILEQNGDVARSPALREYQEIAQRIEKLGQSHIAPRSFKNLHTIAQQFAENKGCHGLSTTNRNPPEIISMKITQPLMGAIYLPSKVVGYEQAYLIAGQWKETWTYRACDKDVPVFLAMNVDGLGGLIPQVTTEENLLK